MFTSPFCWFPIQTGSTDKSVTHKAAKRMWASDIYEEQQLQEVPTVIKRCRHVSRPRRRQQVGLVIIVHILCEICFKILFKLTKCLHDVLQISKLYQTYFHVAVRRNKAYRCQIKVITNSGGFLKCLTMFMYSRNKNNLNGGIIKDTFVWRNLKCFYHIPVIYLRKMWKYFLPTFVDR